jgi:quercetin dioxygenase-like cupin family protein
MIICESLYADYDDKHVISRLNDATFRVNYGTVYGVVLTGVAMTNDRLVLGGEYFVAVAPAVIKSFGVTAIFNRKDWVGRQIIGGAIDPDMGDVRYIDGCTDSLLVAPHRLGDPCLNALYFPPNTDQTFHTHPSIRLGCVLAGGGYACVGDAGEEIQLRVGTVFGIDTDERHRFRTTDKSMLVVAYHPDSDWGPTDEIHPMINRTIV